MNSLKVHPLSIFKFCESGHNEKKLSKSSDEQQNMVYYTVSIFIKQKLSQQHSGVCKHNAKEERHQQRSQRSNYCCPSIWEGL